MSKETQYSNWTIAPDWSASASAAVSGQLGEFILTGSNGNESENLNLFFAGTGVGESFGPQFRGIGNFVEQAATNIVGNATDSISYGIGFSGQTRNALSFEGFGHLIELTVTPGIGYGFQLILFNISLGPQQVPHVVDTLLRFLDGRLSIQRLNSLAPAVAVSVGPAIGIGGGATLYGAYYYLTENFAQRRFDVRRADLHGRRIATQRGDSGTAPTMNQRFRRHR